MKKVIVALAIFSAWGLAAVPDSQAIDFIKVKGGIPAPPGLPAPPGIPVPPPPPGLPALPGVPAPGIHVQTDNGKHLGKYKKGKKFHKEGKKHRKHNN